MLPLSFFSVLALRAYNTPPSTNLVVLPMLRDHFSSLAAKTLIISSTKLHLPVLSIIISSTKLH